MNAMRSASLALMWALAIAGGAHSEPENLAPSGTARSWLQTSLPTAPAAMANDGDPLTFWASNEPTNDPPKDIGIEWAQPVTVGAVVVRFYSMGYVPAQSGWRLDVRVAGQWQDVRARVLNPDCEWWQLEFPPLQTTAVRLVVTAYAHSRPAVSELEVYSSPPVFASRRPALLEGAFWAFHYAHWAQQYATDADLAAEVSRAHAIGLDTLILYTGEGGDGSYATVAPETGVEQIEAWRGRDPLEAILTRADELSMQVYLGDTAPGGYLHTTPPDDAAPLQERLYRHREQLLARYGKHPSLAGYYVNFEVCPTNFGNDPAGPARQVQQLAAFVKAHHPHLRVIQPVGLYRWQEAQEAAEFVKPEQLERFWRPFMQAAPDVDVYTVIDGVGTGLAPLAFTDANQARMRVLCDALGKECWVDVECADFGTYEPMPIGRLAASTEVAARHAQRIVTFCYFNYMAPGNGRETSARLYEQYRAYRLGLLLGSHL